MIQEQFAANVVAIINQDPSVIGLAAAGSWITKELDEYSDLDLVLVTEKKIGGDKQAMLDYAQRFGDLLTGFTGEHVGEPRVLICLYDNPLLHVDIKFVTLEEFHTRIETPVILADTNGRLQKAIDNSEGKFPYPDYQWMEDRFWIWMHYLLGKIGRGEYFEAIDGLSFIRSVVLGPMLHIKNGNLPRGVRKIETQVDHKSAEDLKKTIGAHDAASLLNAVSACIDIYKELRNSLYDEKIVLQKRTEERVMRYFKEGTHPPTPLRAQ